MKVSKKTFLCALAWLESQAHSEMMGWLSKYRRAKYRDQKDAEHCKARSHIWSGRKQAYLKVIKMARDLK